MSTSQYILGAIASIVAVITSLLFLRSRSKDAAKVEVAPTLDPRLEPPKAMPAPKPIEKRIKDNEPTSTAQPSDDDVSDYIDRISRGPGV